MTNRNLIISAFLICLAFILSFFKIWKMPYGGEISLESIPILLVGLLFGLKTGIIAGFVYGIIHLISDFYVLHPLQLILDYPLAYSALGLTGLYSKIPNIFLGITLSFMARFFFHYISGIVFFSSYMPHNLNPALYSAIYNLFYLVPEYLIAIIFLPFLYSKLKVILDIKKFKEV